jgi:hypothetical protein
VEVQGLKPRKLAYGSRQEDEPVGMQAQSAQVAELESELGWDLLELIETKIEIYQSPAKRSNQAISASDDHLQKSQRSFVPVKSVCNFSF